MDYKVISTESEYEQIIKDNLGVLLYFTRPACNVGEALEPKVIKMLEENFPKIPFYMVDMNLTPTIPVIYSVFVEPTIIVVFDGKETIRKARLISIGELSDSIDRIYKLAFD